MRTRSSTCLRSIASVLGLASVLTAAGAAAAGQPPPQGSSYKLLTYNAQFRPDIAELGDDGTAGENQDIYGMSDEDRAALVIQGILGSEAHVVVLQEIFRKEVYKLLVAGLQDKFEYISDWDDLAFDLESQGSGTVIFSQFPMRSLGPVEERAGCMREDAAGDCTVEFLEYDIQEKLYERVTRKGIGYAILENPHTLRPLHLFFTHFQSTAGAFDARAAQVAEATHFIHDRTKNATGDDVAFLGDMNIIAPDVTGFLPNDDVPLEQNVALEYKAQIKGALGDIGLLDTWLSQSPQDPGFSFDPAQNTATTADPKFRQRIDYVLFRSPTSSDKQIRGACAQHAVLERDRFRANTTIDGNDINRDLSDHFALSLLVGRDAPQCDPVRAHLVPGGEQELFRQIVQPGNVQWYRFDKPGTYSLTTVTTDDAPMRVQAYPATDLSTPLQPIEGNVEAVDRDSRVVYDFDGPFFVRVDFADEDRSGFYELHTREHQGASFDDAILLRPHEIFHGLQMTSNVTPELDRVHFKIEQRALHSGKPQRLEFATLATVPLRMRVFNAGEQPIAGLQGAPGQSPLVALPENELVKGEAQTLFVTVDREGCASCDEAGFLFQWTTNYREIDFQKLTVVQQSEGLFSPGTDEVTVFMSVDGGPEEGIFTGPLDTNSNTLINDGVPVGFVDGISLRVVEYDPLIDDYSATRTFEYSDNLDGALQTTSFQLGSSPAGGLYTLGWIATDLSP